MPTRPLRGTRTRRSRILTAAAAAVPAVLVAAGCSATSPAPAEDALATFYEQDLEFGDCGEFASTGDASAVYVDPAECARLLVPLDYDDPDGEMAEIAVLRIAATGSDRIGSLLFNPGGPGASGMAQVAGTVAAAFAETEVAQRFDLVGFDPRGVGASTPTISCFTDEQRDLGEDRTVLFGTAGLWDEDDTSELAAACSEGSGGDDVLANMGTRDVARDLDILRAALGDEQLTFAGQSYGTRIGAVYAEMFPENVRAMILDGVIDPSLGSAERRLLQHTSFQRSFDLMAEFCAQQAECPFGSDPGQATARFQELTRPLIDAPIPAGDGLTLNYDQAVGGVTGGLYDAVNWPDIIAGITALEAGDGTLLRAFSDLFNGRAVADGAWSNQWDANFVINCNDEQRRTPEEEAELRQEIADVNPFMDSGQDFADDTRDGCEQWPSEPSLGIPYAQDVEGLAPPLVISITGDPATPYESGVAIAETLGGALLTVEGEQHTIAQAGTNACVMDVVSAYLIDLEAPADDARCTI